MEQASSKCVDLNTACKVLGNDPALQALVKNAIGSKDTPAALRMMLSGNLYGDLGAIIHDFLIEQIINNSEQVWSGYILQPHDKYPINVHEFHGIYLVLAMEYDPVGYFLDKESAVSFARTNWDNVFEKSDHLIEFEVDADGTLYIINHPDPKSSQEEALIFFRNMDAASKNILGVDIVEGDHPGSTYYAAELKSEINKANCDAIAADIPIRFRARG